LINRLEELYLKQDQQLNRPSKLKFLITSRPYDNLEASSRKFSSTTAYLRFDGDDKSDQISGEINLVIDARVQDIAAGFTIDDAQPRNRTPWDAGGYSLPLSTIQRAPVITDTASDSNPMPGKLFSSRTWLLLMKADMNVPSNLEFYRQIIELENDASRDELLFNNLDHSQQRALMSIAHSRKFEYEYHQSCARVFRSPAAQPD
jgi:hypothetical protein